MLLKNWIVFLIIFTGFSCKTQRSPEPEAPLTISPLCPSNFVSDLEPYIDTIIPIPLETTEHSLIKNTFRLLLLPDKRFILNIGTDLLMFDPEGKYLFTIGKIGRGPEEYGKSHYFCLSKDAQEIWILTWLQDIVIYKSSNGQFVRRFSPEKTKGIQDFIAIASGSGKSFFIFRTPLQTSEKFKPDTYSLLHMDSVGKLLHAYLPQDDYTSDFSTITQSYNNRYILRPYNNTQICYLLQDSIPVPFFKIDFGEKNIPFRYHPDLKRAYNSDYCKIPMEIYDTPQHILFSYMGASYEIYSCFYSLSTGKTITWNSSSKDSHSPFEIVGTDGEYFYGIYSDYRRPEEINLQETEPLKKAIIRKTQLQIKEDENPYLLKIRMKF